MALPDQLADLERKVAARFSEALAEIRAEMRRAVQAEAQRASSAMLAELEAIAPPAARGLLAEQDLLELTRGAGVEAQRAQARSLRAVLVEFDRARTQNGVLESLLAGAQPFGDRVALWLMRPQEIVGWASRGFAGDPIAGRSIAHVAAGALARLATGKGCVLLSASEAAEIASALEIGAPARALFVPLVLRDRIAAALYLDAATAGEFEVEALQLLTLAAAQRLELQALATRTFTPTLYLDREAPEGAGSLALWDPAATAQSSAALEPEVREQPPAQDAPEGAPESAWAASAAGAAAVAQAAETGDDAPVAEEEPATLVESIPTVSLAGLEDRLTESPSEPAAEEISWQLEEADDTAGITAAPAVAGPEEAPAPAPPEAPVGETWFEATPTHEIPLTPEPHESFESLESAESSEPSPAPTETAWREVAMDDATAPHEPYSPNSTQRLVMAPVTHEFPQPQFATPPEPPPAPPPIASLSAATIAFEPPAAAQGNDLSEDATMLMQRPAVEPPPPPAPPVAPPLVPATPGIGDDEPTISRGARTTEVAPPEDLQGPGWAFSSSRAARASGDNALHEEARRLARLLVSEIKLYNEDQVEEGRHNRDIYHRLKDDIDRSRQIYEERVHESVRGTTDYFQQELIRSLAGGDPRALGI